MGARTALDVLRAEYASLGSEIEHLSSVQRSAAQRMGEAREKQLRCLETLADVTAAMSRLGEDPTGATNTASPVRGDDS